jgi:ring-1,2-phenylacetyl-CoA epoxidase subunit PaaE
MELQLCVTKIIRETSDTKSFYLEPVDKSIIINYKAGQFLTLLIFHNEREIRRSYSLGSVHLVDEQLFITVKRKVNGEVSRYLLDHFKGGDILTSLPPSGRFTIYEPLAETYFFVAAGSGITPVFALIKELLYHHSETKIILINQCRNEANIIYKKELHALQQHFINRFQLIQLLSRPISRRYTSQHLNNEMLEKIINEEITKNKSQTNDKPRTANDKRQTINFYLCGPLPFMRMAEFTLRQMGFSQDQIRKEHFVIDAPPIVPLLTDTTPKKVKIHYQQQTYHIAVVYPTSILDAVLEEGIQLPYSCKGGRCSTCAAYCLNGKVVMSMNEVLTDKDIAKGLVLTCVGFAATDAELSFEF